MRRRSVRKKSDPKFLANFTRDTPSDVVEAVAASIRKEQPDRDIVVIRASAPVDGWVIVSLRRGDPTWDVSPRYKHF